MKLKQLASAGLSLALLTSQLGTVAVSASEVNALPAPPETVQSESVPPAVETPPPAVETPPPAMETPPPAVETPPPAVETPPPAVETPPPAVETPPPAVETPPPAVETPPPAVETPPPAVETPPPAVETPPAESTPPADDSEADKTPIEDDEALAEDEGEEKEEETDEEKAEREKLEAEEREAEKLEAEKKAEEEKKKGEKTLMMSASLGGDLASVGGGIIEYYGGGEPHIEVFTQSSSRFYGDPYIPNGVIFRCYGITEGQVSMADFAAATYSIESTDGTPQNAHTPVGKYNIYCNTSLSSINVDGKTINVSYGPAFAGGEVNVNKRPITIAADSKQKAYGEADPTLTYTVTSGSIVPGDTMLGEIFREKAGPATEGVGVYDIKSTLANTNYVITYVPAKLEIVRASLLISASTPIGRTPTIEYGAVVPEVSFTISGLKNNDTVNNAGGGNNIGNITVTCTASNDSVPGGLSPFGSIASATASALESSTGASVAPPPGNYPITVSGLGTVLPNYNVSYTNGSIQINRRTVMVTADSYTKTYSEPDKTLTCTATAPNAATPSAPDTSDSGAAMYPLKYILSRASGETVGRYPISIEVDAGSRQYYDVRYTGADVVIAPAALTVKTNNSTREYGDPNPAFSVSYSGFVNGENKSVLVGNLAFTTSAVRETGVGKYPVMPGGLTSGNYTIQFLPGELVIEKRNVEAHMVATGKVYGQPDGPMTYTLPEAVIDPVNSPLVGIPMRIPGENVGIYKIMANFPNGNYKVKVITADFTITPASLTATVNDATRQYGNENPTFSVRYDGFVRGDTGAVVTGTPVFTTLANPKSPVGNYPVAITGGLSARNYTISFAPGNLSVTQRKLTVMLDIKTQVYGAEEQPLTYTLSESLVDPDGSPLTVSMQREPGVTVGKYAITGTATNPNYDISVKDGLYTITAADLVVRVNDASRVYGNENPDFTVSYEGLQLNDTADALTGELVFDTAANRLSSVGGYPVTATGLTAGNYTVSFAPGTLTIDQRPLVIAVEDKTVEYGEAELPLTYTLSEPLIDPDGSPLVGELTREAGRDADTYAITGEFVNGNYDIHFVPGVYEITPAQLTVKADEITRKYGDENPDFTATGSGFKYEDTLETLDGKLVFDTDADRTTEVGDYTVTVTGVNSKNYTITFEDGTLTIDPRPITVTADSKTVLYGDKEAELTYTLSEKEVDPENNPLVVTLEKPDGKDANAYIITVTAENKNYDITVVPGIHVIQPAPLVIKVVDKERPHGAENPKFEVTYDGFKNGEDDKVLDGELVFKTDATPGSGGGKYTVTVDGVKGKNYSITFVNGTLTVQNPPAQPDPALTPDPAPAPVPAKPKKPASGNPATGNGILETYPLAAPLAGLLAASTAAGAWMLGKKRKRKNDETCETETDSI